MQLHPEPKVLRSGDFRVISPPPQREQREQRVCSGLSVLSGASTEHQHLCNLSLSNFRFPIKQWDSLELDLELNQPEKPGFGRWRGGVNATKCSSIIWKTPPWGWPALIQDQQRRFCEWLAVERRSLGAPDSSGSLSSLCFFISSLAFVSRKSPPSVPPPPNLLSPFKCRQ